MLRIDVWSDIACPWCYVGKRRLEAALERIAERGPVEIVWRSFELDPAAPRVQDTTMSYAERLARKYRTDLPQAQVMLDRMTKVAAGDGLALRFDRIRPGNTFDAHRLLHLAHERGVQNTLKERFLRAYLSEGQAIGDPEVLARLAQEVGLIEDDVSAVLASDEYAREVRSDEREAAQLGITGVPFFVFGGRIGVAGAQTPDVLENALTRGWDELDRLKPEVVAQGAACGVDGCD